MLALEVGALVLGLVAVWLISLLDRPEDAGSVSRGWRQRHEEGREQR